ncbi:hypothetical protein TPE_1315 [Treponema pedis str. T A4]|uniref:Acetyltransferase n=1 Tax=Treponema pedis str. T A4 TaxID=1291379 RepID=S5ZUD7_9SPIR|nr:hypothetical protein TPE_1315 [Treponema pedis str. T A4]
MSFKNWAQIICGYWKKNTKAVSFYKRHGFNLTGEKKLEEGTPEYLLRMVR